MRPDSDLLRDIISGPFQRRLIVDAFYDDEATISDLPISAWKLTGDLESEIKTNATLTAVYTGNAGETIAPRGFLDRLAPFGQQVNVLMECSLLGQSATIQMGRYRINVVPETSESYLQFSGRTLVSGSKVQLTCDDLLSSVKRNGMRWPSPPIVTGSTWSELQRLTGFPIAQTLPDKPTPSGLIYQTKAGGRLLAVQQLASHLGGIATTNSFGELTVVPFAPSDPVLRLTEGRVKTPPRSLDSDELYNWVVGEYQEEDGTPIYAEDWVRSGPLAAEGPFGPYTYSDSSDTIRTQTAADQRVREVLARLLRDQSYRVTVSCRLDPRIEQGDVIEVLPTDGQLITGRVVSYEMDGSPFMTVVLDVARDVPTA